MSQLYGLDAELAAKSKEKYDPEREQKARDFVERVLELDGNEVELGRGLAFQDWLKVDLLLSIYLLSIYSIHTLQVYRVPFPGPWSLATIFHLLSIY